MATDPNAPGDTTYRASKKYAEKAAWEFMEENKTSWDLATINNTYTFGPLPRSLDVKSQGGEGGFKVNTSNERIADCLTGKWHDKIPPTAPVFTFVDVRDVAVAHVRAMTRREAGGKRFYVVGGFFSNPKIAAIVHGVEKTRLQPSRVKAATAKSQAGGDEKEDKEDKAVMCGACLHHDDFPVGKHWAFDNTRSKEVLGLEYRGLGESVVDTVKSLRGIGIGPEKEVVQIVHHGYGEGGVDALQT